MSTVGWLMFVFFVLYLQDPRGRNENEKAPGQVFGSDQIHH